MTYCEFIKTNELHKKYHDHEYGFPLSDDNALLERLALEINQAGLSWDLMLKKRAALNKAFKGFEVEKVARFGTRDIERLLSDEGIVRNRRKIEAVIHNAKVMRELQKAYGTFAAWLALRSSEAKDEKEWVKLFKKQGFQFVGREIIKEFLQSIGYLNSPHAEDCPIVKDIFKAKVLAIVKAIPKGETMTYGEVAAAAGRPQAARAVGAFMRQNQDKRIPCHRVVARSGLGGYNGLRGPSKEKLLKEERRSATKTRAS